jgi:hypothetical protein
VSLAHLGLLRRRASLDRTSMRPNPHTSQVTTDEPLDVSGQAYFRAKDPKLELL